MSKMRSIESILNSVSITHKFDKDKLVFLNTSDVSEGEILVDKFMSVASLKGQAKKTIKNDDILFSEIRPKNKRYAFVNVPNPDDYVVSTKLMVLRNKTKDVLTRYVYYFLTSDATLDYLQMRAENRIGSFPQITFDIVKVLELNVPETKVQQKIIHVIDAIDSKIELNRKINSELEALAKTLYDYWFVQFDFPDAKGKPYKSSGGKMSFNEKLKRHVPEGWEVEILNNVVDNILDHRGRTPLKLGGDWANKGEGVIALSAKHVKDGKLVKLEDANIVAFEMYKKWMPEKLKEGDILMTSEAPLGEFYFILNDTDYCMSQRLFAIRADITKVFPSYLYYELSKGNGYSQIIGKASGSTVFGIRQDELRKVNILKPKLDVQKIFDEKVKPMLFQIRNNEFQNRQLAELRDWLLPMLMNGQVKVNQVLKEGLKEDRNPLRLNQTQWQTLLLARYINALKSQKPKPILQGEVGIAKYAYLADKIFGVGSGFKYKQHNFGPYDSSINDRLSTKKYFQKTGDRFYKVFDLTASGEELAVSTDVDFSTADIAMKELTEIFSKFKKDKTHELELMASICWQMEKMQSSNLKKIWQGFKSWKISGRKEKNKAEVFTEGEVKNCLETIVTKGWHKKLIR